MLRYGRLFLRFVEFSVGRAVEFRFDFFFRVAMDVVFYVVNIAFFKILYLHTPGIGGWSDAQAMIFVAGFCVIDAMSMTLFSNNLWWFPIMVNKGDLDYHLVRPVSPLFMVSLRDFAANSFINFVMSLGILGWAVARYPGPFGAGRMALYGCFLLIGLLIHYLLRMTFLIPVFWTHSVRGLDTMYFQASRVIERPDGIFRGWVRGLFTTVLPFCLIASFPTKLVVEGFDWSVFAHLAAGAVLYSVAVGLFWRQGLRAYSSASS